MGKAMNLINLEYLESYKLINDKQKEFNNRSFLLFFDITHISVDHRDSLGLIMPYYT